MRAKLLEDKDVDDWCPKCRFRMGQKSCGDCKTEEEVDAAWDGENGEEPGSRQAALILLTEAWMKWPSGHLK